MNLCLTLQNNNLYPLSHQRSYYICRYVGVKELCLCSWGWVQCHVNLPNLSTCLFPLFTYFIIVCSPLYINGHIVFMSLMSCKPSKMSPCLFSLFTSFRLFPSLHQWSYCQETVSLWVQCHVSLPHAQCQLAYFPFHFSYRCSKLFTSFAHTNDFE